MKKNYNKPTIVMSITCVKSSITAITKYGMTTNTVDAHMVDETIIDTDLDPTSINASTNQRGGFGTDAGPWESLW